MKKTGYSTSSIPALAPASLLFFGIGLCSLLGGMLAVLLNPEILLAAAVTDGVPEIGESAPVIGSLLVIGGVSSFIFGAAYVLLPLVAATAIWSRKLVWLHLAVHGCGVVWMTFGLVAADRTAVENGGFFVLIGIVAFVLNLIATASRFNRWEPAQLTLVAAIFWLVVSSLAGVAYLLAEIVPLTDVLAMSREELVVAHVAVYVGGFLWMAFLGAGVKIMTMFGVSQRHPGVLAWVGLCLTNLAVFLVIPGLIVFGGAIQQPLAALALIGGMCYLAEAVRLFGSSRQVVDAGHWTVLGGYFSGLVLLFWIVCGLPGLTEGGLDSWQAAGACVLLAVLGPFLFAIFGAGTRMIPFLVWQLRCLPQLVRGSEGAGFAVPEVSQLCHGVARIVILVCLVMGWGYMGAGFVGREVAGFQLGMVSLLIAFGFFVYAISPALRLWLASDALFLSPVDVNQRKTAPSER